MRVELGGQVRVLFWPIYVLGGAGVYVYVIGYLGISSRTSRE